MPKRFEDSPALRFRAPGFPKHFNGQVPRRIKPRFNVHPDWPATGAPAVGGAVYDTWTNSYGAVFAIISGELLGMKPDEFDVVEWVEEHVPRGDPHG